MLLFRFSRESRDQCGAKRDIRNFSPELTDDIYQFLFCRSSSHTFENLIIGMLDWKIQIMTDFWFFLNRLNQFIINFFRITI